MRLSSHDGFTIAEVLVAILVTAIVAGVIYGSYMGGIKIIYSAEKDMERTSMARLVLDRITTDLSCAFLRPGKEYLVFVGTEAAGSEHPSDTLTFIASNRERSGRDAPESILCEVSYALDPGGQGELFILRREDPTLDEDPFSGGETRAIGEGIAGLKFDYAGEGGWESSWDSRESSSLPKAVRVTIECLTEEEAGGAEGEEAVRYTTFQAVAAVPLGGSWEEEDEEEESATVQATPTPK